MSCSDEISAEDRAQLHRESGGNPFYLQALLRADRSDGRRASAAGEWAAEVPESVTVALASELGELARRPRDARGRGRRRRPVRSRARGDRGGHRRGSRAGPARRADGFGSGATDRASAPLPLPSSDRAKRGLRLDEAGPATRSARAAGRCVGERGVAPVEYGHHLACSAAVGDERSIALLTQAAHAALPRAPATAAHWFDAALRLLATDDPEARLQLLSPMATALGASGQITESRDALREAIALVPADAGTERTRLVAACSGMDFALGRSDEARSLLLGALAELPTGDPAEAATLKLRWPP